MTQAAMAQLLAQMLGNSGTAGATGAAAGGGADFVGPPGELRQPITAVAANNAGTQSGKGGPSFGDILRGAIEGAFPQVGAEAETKRERDFKADEAQKTRDANTAQADADRVLRSDAFRAFQDRLRAESARKLAAFDKKGTELESGKSRAALLDEIKKAQDTGQDPALIKSLQDKYAELVGVSPEAASTLDPASGGGSPGGGRGPLESVANFFGGPAGGAGALDPNQDTQLAATSALTTGQDPLIAAQNAQMGLGAPAGAANLGQPDVSSARSVFSAEGTPVPITATSQAAQAQAPAMTTMETFGLNDVQQQSVLSDLEIKIPRIREFMMSPEGAETVKKAINIIGSTDKDGTIVTANEVIAALKRRFGVE